MFFDDRVATSSTEVPHITHHNPLSLLFLFLPFFLTAVSAAYLQYGSTQLSDPQPNVMLTVGVTNQRVFCVQNTGSVPTSIEWYDPQGQLVSKDTMEEVNQVDGTGSGNNRTAILTFQSYQQSQSGKYECRVAGPGNNLKSLSICIGERYTFLLTVKPTSSDSRVFLVPSIY